MTITNFSGSLTGSAPSPSPGATVTLTGADTGSATIGSNSTLEIANGASLTGTIAFGATSGGTLKIDGTTMPSAVINGFAPYIPSDPNNPGTAPYPGADTIDLTGVDYNPLGFTNFSVPGNSVQNNVLQITENSQTYNLNFGSQNFNNEVFELSNDGSGHTDINLIQKNPNAGFDIDGYPGPKAMKALWSNTNLSWVGYYLGGGVRGNSNSWTNQGASYTYLTQQLGWKVSFIYEGRQDASYSGSPVVPNDATLAQIQVWAKADGDFAKAQASVAGAARNTGVIIYLAIEQSNGIDGQGTLSNAELQYIKDWCSVVSSDGYTPGIYYNAASNGPSIDSIAGPLTQLYGTPLWASRYNYPTPSNLTIIPTPNPSNIDVNATGWQYKSEYKIGEISVDLDFFQTQALLLLLRTSKRAISPAPLYSPTLTAPASSQLTMRRPRPTPTATSP